MAKKILGWLIFVLISVFIGFVIWLLFFNKEVEDPNFQPQGRGEDFFPVDNSNNLERAEEDIPENNTEEIGRNFIPRLRQLSTVPTAGGVAFERTRGSSRTFITEDGVEETSSDSVTIFRYIERATGHLYETRENTLTQTRLSNTTIPKVYFAEFAPNGENVLLSLLDEDEETIQTLSATVTSKSTTSPSTFRLVADGYALEGSFLSPNTTSSDIDERGLAYIVPNSSGGSSLITSNYDDLSKNLVFESPLREWIAQRVNSNRVLITTKADSRVNGFSYLVNTGTGANEKIIGDISGLTSLMSEDQKWLIFSLSRENELDLFSLNTETGETKNLGLETLPEKCVFANTDNDIVFCAAPTQAERVPYPETWYQGLTSFKDNLWRINLEEEEFDQLLGDKEELEQSFDMTQLVMSPRDQFMLFINKKDLTLWSLDVTTIER
ncbi:hypothetical protein N9L18_00095 [Candidatus Pacebacteria bacterium]|nr:hypothetical protein [Candidatus Paceibacterota bacterium]